MKKFVISMLCASVFFLGLGGLVDSVGARFSQDDKARQIIELARMAIGGDTNLREVRAMTINGQVTHFREKEGVINPELGAMEINFEMPNRFSKSMKFGDPSNLGGDGGIHTTMDVIVVEKDGEEMNFTSDGDADKNVFVIKKDDGNVEWVSEGDGNVKIDGHKVLVRKPNGEMAELPEDGKKNVIVRKRADGDTAVWNTEDGNKIVVEKADHAFGPHKNFRHNEMLRTTMALLMSAPDGIDVNYKFEGEGNVDGYPTNIVAVESHGSSFKLHIDASSNLPRMISFTGPNVVFFHKKNDGDVTKEEVIEMKRKMAEPMEHQIRFSDFRGVDGLLLPHRWSETVGGKQREIIDIISYEINPANIADKFGKNKVFVRKMKPENN